MISYNYKKYKNISDFIFDKPNGSDKPFSILQKCGGVSGNEYNDKCFGCFFCAFNDKDRMTKLLNRFDQDFLEKVIQESFGGTPIKFPPFKGSSEYSSIEKFTTVNEKQHIQPWVTGLVHNMCTKQNRISMEIPIPHPDYRRVGRLDVGCITSDHMLALETKTNVADALNDERFVEQHIKYTEVIDSITKDYTYLTFIGGKETDLYPESSSFCTGMSGNSAERFLKLLDDNGIQALTATALWCLCCKYIKQGNAFAWDKFIVDIFRNPECLCLTSAGMIKRVNKKMLIEPVTL